MARKQSVTRTQIRALRDEAGAAGDLHQVATCDRALAGSPRAQELCAKVIAEASAMVNGRRRKNSFVGLLPNPRWKNGQARKKNARRYSGSVTVNVVWNDARSMWKATIAQGGKHVSTQWVGRAPADRLAVDSPAAHDSAARAALAFAAHEGIDLDAAYDDVGYAISRSRSRSNGRRPNFRNVEGIDSFRSSVVVDTTASGIRNPVMRSRKNSGGGWGEGPVVGHAKLVYVRQPFRKSRRAWKYEGFGPVMLPDSHLPRGAVRLGDDLLLDLSTGEVHRERSNGRRSR